MNNVGLLCQACKNYISALNVNTSELIATDLMGISEALIGVFGSKGALPKKGREQGSMKEKFGSLGAHDFIFGKSF